MANVGIMSGISSWAGTSISMKSMVSCRDLVFTVSLVSAPSGRGSEAPALPERIPLI